MSTEPHHLSALLHQPAQSSDGAMQRSFEHLYRSEDVVTRTLSVPTLGDSLSLEELGAWLHSTLHRETGRPLAESLTAPVSAFVAAAVEAYARPAHPVAIAADALRFPADLLDESRTAIERGFVDSLFIEAYPTVDVMQRICDPLTTGVLPYAIAASNARSPHLAVSPELDLDTVRFAASPIDGHSSWDVVWDSGERQQGAYAFAGYQRLFFSRGSVADPRGPRDLDSSAFVRSTNCEVGRMLSPLEWLCVMELRPHIHGHVITGDAEWLRGVTSDGALVGCQSVTRNSLFSLAPDDILNCNAHRIAVG